MNRSIGGLTGSRIAGAFGRVPVERMIQIHASKRQSLSFHSSLAVGSWVDTLYAFADSPFKAISILREAEQYLWEEWGLKIKPSSKMYMCAIGSDQGKVPGDYKKVSVLPFLGHLVAPTGTSKQCVDMTLKCMALLLG